ncbi:hypothetical protein Tco_0945980 [Tanacetum coccineum]
MPEILALRLALEYNITIEGVLRVELFSKWRVNGAAVGWKLVWECRKVYWEERIGPSKSSQSLSIAHKWAVVID